MLDSNEEDEYQETLAKMAGVMAAVKGAEKRLCQDSGEEHAEAESDAARRHRAVCVQGGKKESLEKKEASSKGSKELVKNAVLLVDNYDSFTFQVTDGQSYGVNPAVMTIDVQENVGTTENTLNVRALLSPNQASETVRLSLNFQETPGALTFSIVDAFGKVQKTWTQEVAQPGFQTTLDVAGLTPGMYLLHLNAGGRMTTLRFVKN